MTLGAMAGVLAILVHRFFHFNLYVPANAVLFTVLAGIASRPVPGAWFHCFVQQQSLFCERDPLSDHQRL